MLKLTVQPKLNKRDRKALSAFVKTLKRERPEYVQHGSSFTYRGSRVTVTDTELVRKNSLLAAANSFSATLEYRYRPDEFFA